MAHSRSHSQPVQYRYRPNGPTRSASTVISPDSLANALPSTGYGMSHLTNGPPTHPSSAEVPLLHSYLHAGSEAIGSFGTPLNKAFSTMMEQPTLNFTGCLQKKDYPAQLSPTTPSWISENNSVNSDSCAGGAWSSPTSNMSFSPEPAYQIPYMENASWPPHNYNPYFAGHCMPTQEVLPSQVLESDYMTTPVYYPDVSQQWQCQYTGDSLLPAYEFAEYCSSRGTSESVSERASSSSEAMAVALSRSDSLMAETSSSSPSILPSQVSGSVSPTSMSKTSQYQGQLLEFSTPVAQAKAKGPKFAALPCPLAAFGCTSSFISKNEWKRHINTQHLRLEAWLCDQCPKRDNKREFNRKDLFIQHLKRMHPPPCPAHSQTAQPMKSKPNKSTSKNEKTGKASKGEDLDPALLGAEQRCHLVLRQPPSESACLFCSTNFSGRGSWETRIEHVAKHMEQFKKEGSEVPSPQTWRADHALEQWLVSEGVITKVRQRWSVV